MTSVFPQYYNLYSLNALNSKVEIYIHDRVLDPLNTHNTFLSEKTGFKLQKNVKARYF